LIGGTLGYTLNKRIVEGMTSRERNYSEEMLRERSEDRIGGGILEIEDGRVL
jgi:hypothetical protein